MNDTTIRLTAVLADLEHGGRESRSFPAFRAAARDNATTGSGKTFLDVLLAIAERSAS